MIVIKVELWPMGDSSRAKTLGTARIANIGGDITKGNYECVLCDSIELPEDDIEKYKFLFYSKGNKRIWKECEIKDFPRKRLLVWDLLYRGLKKIIGERNDFS